jgi:ubiquinone/menaquinone biosynthesis C-methylase UbiE
MHPLSCHFSGPLTDLGEVEDINFKGVLTPQGEVGKKREGVNAAFLEDAEDYYLKHQGFEYWKMLFAAAFKKIGLEDAPLVIEYGCGFGNSTLPLLDLLPTSAIIASDISPNLLAIAKRLVDRRNFEDRCLLVAMDAQKPFIREGIADLVVGSAILHHLADPHLFVAAATRVLKPTGSAIFFEPFELGNALLRMLSLDIVAEAAKREETNAAIEWLPNLATALNLQIRRDRDLGWRDLDDKWVFPRSMLQDMADACGCDLITYPLEAASGKFRSQFEYMLNNFAQIHPCTLPSWAWAMIDRLDTDIFSPASMRDVIISGAVIFRKR